MGCILRCFEDETIKNMSSSHSIHHLVLIVFKDAFRIFASAEVSFKTTDDISH